MTDAAKQTLLAQVYDVAVRTPLDRAAKLSSQVDGNVYLKREDLQPVHSFKLRGAYNKIAQLSPVQRKRGVIAASAGNHAQGVALAARKLDISALIVMPRTTPSIKVEAVQSYGADVELVGDSYTDAYEHCQQRITQTGRTFIHPFDDPLVIAGQGTVGREILEQLPDVTHIFVPVGGGGLIAGIGQYVKSLRPEVQVIGVEPVDSNALTASLAAKERVYLDHVGIFADGVAVKQLGEHTFALAQRYVDNCLTVTTDELCAAIKAIYEDARAIVEPAGALGVAGIVAFARRNPAATAGMKAVAICSGANMSFEKLQFVAERTLLGSGKEALFAVQLPEQPQALQQFCTEVVNSYNITQFGYRLRDRDQATILVGIGVPDQAAKQAFMTRMEDKRYAYQDFSDNDLTKEHIRHMVGGPAATAQHEHFYHIQFPERPGALGDFLQAVSSRWNISLFHYRGLGGDEGMVLVGFETVDKAALQAALSKTGYPWQCVDDDKSLQAFVAADSV